MQGVVCSMHQVKVSSALFHACTVRFENVCPHLSYSGFCIAPDEKLLLLKIGRLVAHAYCRWSTDYLALVVSSFFLLIFMVKKFTTHLLYVQDNVRFWKKRRSAACFVWTCKPVSNASVVLFSCVSFVCGYEQNACLISSFFFNTCRAC